MSSAAESGAAVESGWMVQAGRWLAAAGGGLVPSAHPWSWSPGLAMQTANHGQTFILPFAFCLNPLM